jgi:hypothetical protein
MFWHRIRSYYRLVRHSMGRFGNLYFQLVPHPMPALGDCTPKGTRKPSASCDL